jgi:DNA-binding PadR family transcriptional regulator
VSRSGSQQHRSGNISPEFALLGLLLAGPDHGYNLHQRISADLGHVWHLSQSQSYTILKRLENRGDISARVVEQRKLPDRQMLRITAQGRRRFMAWLEEGVSSNARAIRLEFLTRLYFSSLYTPEDTSRIFDTQFTAIAENIGRLERIRSQLPPGGTFNLLSLDLRLRQLRLIQEWMAEIRTQFGIPSKVTP